MHLAGVDAARGTGITRLMLAQSWSKNRPRGRSCLGHHVAADVVEALHRHRVAFELADRGAGVQVVDAGQAQPLGDDAKRDAVVLLPV